MKKTIRKIHLLLGLISGIIVFIIAITGCLYAFQEEIQNITEDYRFVQKQNSPFLLPSKLETIARRELPNKTLHAIQYKGKEKSAEAIFFHFDEKILSPSVASTRESISGFSASNISFSFSACEVFKGRSFNSSLIFSFGQTLKVPSSKVTNNSPLSILTFRGSLAVEIFPRKSPERDQNSIPFFPFSLPLLVAMTI